MKKPKKTPTTIDTTLTRSKAMQRTIGLGFARAGRSARPHGEDRPRARAEGRRPSGWTGWE